MNHPDTSAAARIVWRRATVVESRWETTTTRTLLLDVPEWPGHRAGQHVDVRLTAEDGYQAERSYSIASPPEEPRLALTVERLEDGEVSPYLADVVQVGETVELRGPIGGYFVWSVAVGGPLLLVAGGSGIVPLMAMVRHRAAAQAVSPNSTVIPTKLLYSSRRWEDVIYRDELDRLARADATLQVSHTLTRGAPSEWTGYRRRIDREMLAEFAWPAADLPRVFVCGPTAMVETVASALVELGHPAPTVKTERFGPTGSTASADSGARE